MPSGLHADYFFACGAHGGACVPAVFISGFNFIPAGLWYLFTKNGCYIVRAGAVARARPPRIRTPRVTRL